MVNMAGFEALEQRERDTAAEMGWSEDFVLSHWPLSAYGRAIRRERAAQQARSREVDHHVESSPSSSAS